MYWHKSTWEKVARYYKGTYIKIPECSSLVYVSEVGPSLSRMKDKEGNVYEVDMHNGFNLEFTLPVNRIYFQHEGNAWLLVRHPARQYRRGFSPENTLLFRLNGDGGLVPRELNWDVLNSVVNKLPYNTINSAQAKLRNVAGMGSLVLTHRIAMVKNGLLYVDMLPVGAFVTKKNKIVCLPAYAPIFYEFLKSGDSGTVIEVKDE